MSGLQLGGGGGGGGYASCTCEQDLLETMTEYLVSTEWRHQTGR